MKLFFPHFPSQKFEKWSKPLLGVVLRGKKKKKTFKSHGQKSLPWGPRRQIYLWGEGGQTHLYYPNMLRVDTKMRVHALYMSTCRALKKTPSQLPLNQLTDRDQQTKPQPHCDVGAGGSPTVERYIYVVWVG